jgi:UDP-glucose 4-epimerase
MQVAITGGSGQLGTVLLRRLAADRTIKRIVAIDLRPPSVAGAKIEAVRADVRDPGLAARFAGCDAVIHLAFVVTGNPARDVFEAINVGGSKNVFDCAVAAGAKHVLYSSSVAAYGVTSGHPDPIVESTPRKFVPDFAYSATKFQVEAYLDELERAHPDVRVTRFRPGILVGTHMDHPLGEALKKRRIVQVHDSPMPVVWDEDVADAFMLALKKQAAGAFNVVSDDALSSSGLGAAAGLKVIRAPLAIALGAARLSPVLARLGIGRSVDPAWVTHMGHRMSFSSEKAKRELGWQPKCPTAASVMRRYVEANTGKTDLRIALFMKLAAAAARRAPPLPEGQRIDLLVHLALTGVGGGDWTFDVRDGRLAIKPGIPRPPQSVLTLKASTFLDLMSGKADFGSAQLTGKIRVEGEPRATMILGAMVAMFRKGTSEKGARGAATRTMSAWFAA